MAKKQSTTISVEQLECPLDLYPRTKLPGEKDVQHLIGVGFPPITTAQILTEPDSEDTEGVVTIVVDGAHRLQAAKEQGWKEIKCEDLGLMTEAEVLDEAIRRNRTHGKQLSMADKAKLTRIFATNGMKVADIVAHLSIGERSVSRWASEAKETKKLKDFAEISKLIEKGCSLAGAAREVGVSRSTAQGWMDSPPTKKDRTPPPSKDGPGLKDNPATAECPDRVEALAQVIIEDANDIAKEMDESSWVEICEAVVAEIRKSYPKSWKS